MSSRRPSDVIELDRARFSLTASFSLSLGRIRCFIGIIFGRLPFVVRSRSVPLTSSGETLVLPRSAPRSVTHIFRPGDAL